MPQYSRCYRTTGAHLSSDLPADAEYQPFEHTSGSVKHDNGETQSSQPNKMVGQHFSLRCILEQWTRFVILGNLAASVAALVISMYAPPMVNRSSNLNYDFTSWKIFHVLCATVWYSIYYKETSNLESCLARLRQLSLVITGLQCISHAMLSVGLIITSWIASEELSQPLFSYATFPLLQFSSLISLPVIQLLICVNSFTQTTSGQNSNKASYLKHKDVDANSYIDQSCYQLKNATNMVLGILEQYASEPLHTSSQEILSTCSMAMPIASMLAINTAMKQVVHISSVLQQYATSSLRDSAEQSPSHRISSEANKKFDLSETLQTIGDVMEGVYTKQGVPLVIQLVDSEWKQVNVIGNQAGLRHCLICVLTSMLQISTSGSTVELAMTFSRPDDTQVDKKSQCNKLKFDIDISLIPNPSEDMTDKLQLALDPGNIELFDGSVTIIQISESKGPIVNVSFEMEQGEESNGDIPINDEGVTLVNPDSSELVTIRSLEGFYELLKNMKIALYAMDDSLFAKHLTTCLSNWSTSVAYFSIDDEKNGEKADQSMDPRPQLSVRTQQVSQATGPTSPYHTQPKSDDSVNPMTADIIIVDDDIHALKQQIANRQAAFSADAARRSRQLFRTKKGYGSLNSTSQATILHFTSLENYKQVRDIIISNLDPFSKPSFALAHIVAVPKPACPRRILAALYTAWSKTTVGPQFTPIATLPNSPASTTSSISSAGQSQDHLTSSGPSSLDPHSPEKGPRKMDRGPNSPKIRDVESGQYFPSAQLHTSTSHIGRHNCNSSEGSPTGMVVEDGILFSPAAKNTNTKHKSNGSKSHLRNIVPTSGERASESKVEASPTRDPKDLDIGAVEPQPQEKPQRPKVELIGRKDSSLASKGSGRSSPIKSPKHRNPSFISAPPIAQSPQEIEEKSVVSVPIINLPSSLDSGKTDQTQSSGDASKSDSQDSVSSEPGKFLEHSIAKRLSARRKRKSVSRSLVSAPIKVLIVEDNIINQVILSKWMKNHNITYDVAGNGQEAFDKWNSGGFHLVLMDIQLPVMDGLTATKKIRACEKEPNQKDSSSNLTHDATMTAISKKDMVDCQPEPEFRSPVIIVALTASSLDSDRQEALAAGCNDFLTKPVSLEWLERKITEWGSMQALIDYEGWRQWRESKKLAKQVESKPTLATPKAATPTASSSPDRSGVLMQGGEAIKRQKRRSVAP